MDVDDSVASTRDTIRDMEHGPSLTSRSSRVLPDLASNPDTKAALALGGLLAVFGILGVAVTVLASIIGVTTRFDSMVMVVSTAVTALAAVAMFVLSLNSVRENRRIAAIQQDSQVEQSKVMAAQQTAMEAQAAAMQSLAAETQVSAAATKDMATIALRTFAADYPSSIKISDVRFGTIKGDLVTIDCTIENVGHLPANLLKVETRDYHTFEGRDLLSTLRVMNSDPEVHEHLQGKQIVRTKPVAISHTCAHVSEAILGPRQTVSQMLKGEEPEETGMTVSFDVMVAYVDEAGALHRAYGVFYCRPPSRYLRDRPAMLSVRAARRADGK